LGADKQAQAASPAPGGVKASRSLDSPRARPAHARDVARAWRDAAAADGGGTTPRRNGAEARAHEQHSAAAVRTRVTGERGKTASGGAAGSSGGGGRLVSWSGCGRREGWRSVGTERGGGGGGASARNRMGAHRRRRTAVAGGRREEEAAGGEKLGFSGEEEATRLNGRGEERAGGRGVIPDRGHAGQPAGAEATPPRGRPTGGRGRTRKMEGGTDGWGRGRGESLTDGAGQENNRKSKALISKFENCYFPWVQNFPNFYWSKITLPRTQCKNKHSKSY
jgi:hypothetical protein